nr:Extra-large GTP-binding protein 3 [Ipomoea batatas]
MGDSETLAKARRELQDLYLGVPDDSVNLSFKELAEVTQRKAAAFSSQLSLHKKSPPPSENSSKPPPSLAKLPSLDFSRALEAHHHHLDQYGHHGSPYGHHAINGHHGSPYGHHAINEHHGSPYGHHAINGHEHHHHVALDHRSSSSMGYLDNDDMMRMAAAATPNQARRRRPGIPHSNICTLCTTYIYIFRYRCLVCGRVYCRQCVGIGMGDMAEGRKCVECLGRRFSHRYIHKAGQMGWCMGYPNAVRQQELKWAEKGPNRSRENRPAQSTMLSSSRTRSPITRTSPHNTPPSFVMNSPLSPYTPTHHHALPF